LSKNKAWNKQKQNFKVFHINFEKLFILVLNFLKISLNKNKLN
jgi:hypothetical protein